MTRAALIGVLALAGCAAHPVPRGIIAERLPARVHTIVRTRIVYVQRSVPVIDQTCAASPKNPWGASPAAMGGYIAALQHAAADCREKLHAALTCSRP